MIKRLAPAVKDSIDIAAKKWAEMFGINAFNFSDADKEAVGEAANILLSYYLRKRNATIKTVRAELIMGGCIETAAERWAQMAGRSVHDLYTLKEADRKAVGKLAATLLEYVLEDDEV